MYSRFPGRRDRESEPIRVPKHYSGCVFVPQEPTHREDTESKPRPSPPSPSMEAALPPPIPQEPITPVPSVEEKAVTTSLLSGFSPSFLEGLGFEELLLVGLILLLARSDQESDIVLWLALLLFCK